MNKEDNEIDKLKQKKTNINKDEQLQNEIKKWEVESTKGGKLNKKSASTNTQ
jgi:hypothetical protein